MPRCRQRCVVRDHRAGTDRRDDAATARRVRLAHRGLARVPLSDRQCAPARPWSPARPRGLGAGVRDRSPPSRLQVIVQHCRTIATSASSYWWTRRWRTPSARSPFIAHQPVVDDSPRRPIPSPPSATTLVVDHRGDRHRELGLVVPGRAPTRRHERIAITRVDVLVVRDRSELPDVVHTPRDRPARVTPTTRPHDAGHRAIHPGFERCSSPRLRGLATKPIDQERQWRFADCFPALVVCFPAARGTTS